MPNFQEVRVSIMGYRKRTIFFTGSIKQMQFHKEIYSLYAEFDPPSNIHILDTNNVFG